jgi:serine protease
MRRFFVAILIGLCIISFAIHPRVTTAAGVPESIRKNFVASLTKSRQTWWDAKADFWPNILVVKYKEAGGNANQSAANIAGNHVGQAAASVRSFYSTLGVTKEVPMFPEMVKQIKNNPIGSVTEDNGLSRIYNVVFSATRDVREVALELSKDPNVEYAEPRFIRHVDYIPNDYNFYNGGPSWWLEKIQATQAWDVTKGDTSIVIGIVDTGVQWDHPDLAGNIKRNWGEIPNNGIDDDHNGHIDDIHGWDFGGVNNIPPYQEALADNDPREYVGFHGTHCAGIAGAVTDNGTGIASIGFKCKIIPVKTAYDNDPGWTGSGPGIIYGFEGIKYCADNGAKIISCSWDGGGSSQAEQDVITYATLTKGALVVAAAGNDGLDTDASANFPSCYKYVFAIGATTSSDTRASFSNYGTQSVGVMAPGNVILSTFQSNTYAYESGTSMATPMAAGLAGLVAAVFPSYTPEQIAEQVRITADNIDALNSGYTHKLGFGRINAHKAVSVTNSPAIRMTDVVLKDANGDGFITDGEVVKIKMSLKNYLAAASNITVTISAQANGNYVTLNTATRNFASLGTLQTVVDSLFQFTVGSNVPQGTTVDFLVTITSGSYIDYGRFFATIKPTYRNISVAGNNIQFTATNQGQLAFNDFPNNTQGVGFKYYGYNLLYEGNIMFGNSATQIVEAMRNASGTQDADFAGVGAVTITQPAAYSSLQVTAKMADANAPTANIMNLGVTEDLFVWSTPPDTSYVILRLEAKNNATTAYTNFYAGAFFDWDIGVDGAGDSTAYDAVRGLGYAFNNSTGYYTGLMSLETPTASYRALDNNDANLQLNRSDKWSYLSGGTVNTVIGPTDISVVIGAGPLNVPAGGKGIAAFALIAAKNLIGLQASADAAKTKWASIRSLVGIKQGIVNVPAVFKLAQNYPNPFNPSTNISYSLANTQKVSLKVFDVLGREVSTLVSQSQPAGTYTVSFNASKLSSGVYFYRLVAGDFVQTKKMLLVK